MASALHAAHALGDEAARQLVLAEADRLREEDPHTDRWARALAPSCILALRSRFEVDFNRPRDRSVYRGPEDAWGLRLWEAGPPEALVERSRAAYVAFYSEVLDFLERKAEAGPVCLLDLHAYCHRRAGPEGPQADPAGNPEINLGTATVQPRFRPLISRLGADLAAFDFEGRSLDVRENVKFRGGVFVRSVNELLGERGCAVAIEVKKIYIDEWSGELDSGRFEAIGEALGSAVPGVIEELTRL